MCSSDLLASLPHRLVSLGFGFDLAERGHGSARSANPVSSPGLDGQVVAALSEAGWIPQLSPANTADTEGCLRVSPGPASEDLSAAGLDVVFKQAVPSVFALGQLAPFAEIAPGAPHDVRLTARLTPASLRAALSQGISLDEILAILAHLHDGALPVQVEDSLRRWARFYGSAAISAVCLIEFSDANVLNNLLDDVDIGQYLLPIEGSDRALATVDPAHIETVREFLQERGIRQM